MPCPSERWNWPRRPLRTYNWSDFNMKPSGFTGGLEKFDHSVSIRSWRIELLLLLNGASGALLLCCSVVCSPGAAAPCVEFNQSAPLWCSGALWLNYMHSDTAPERQTTEHQSTRALEHRRNPVLSVGWFSLQRHCYGSGEGGRFRPRPRQRNSYAAFGRLIYGLRRSCACY